MGRGEKGKRPRFNIVIEISTMLSLQRKWRFVSWDIIVSMKCGILKPQRHIFIQHSNIEECRKTCDEVPLGIIKRGGWGGGGEVVEA